ncbi:uncharacterized protein LOC143828342 [Paroedura picta]|uniref:uncharacterized protein LOC143828342 n=1 Tax=Paroedura picta TaxID=143630 RepID=UPI004055E3B7
METATLKRLLLAFFAAATLLGIFCAHGAPPHRCRQLPLQLRLLKLQEPESPARKLRVKYEHLLKREPAWQNCSAEHRRPKWKLSDLRGWDTLEALENMVSLSRRVLQNRTVGVADKVTEKVLDTLKPLEDELQACMDKKPSGRNESEELRKFKEEFRRFKASNLEQSPQCLEAAVGLDIYRLWKEDISHLLNCVLTKARPPASCVSHP